MYIITWITHTLGVKRESFASLAAASKRLRFLQVHNISATLEVR
jgi:hypothetical protein